MNLPVCEFFRLLFFGFYVIRLKCIQFFLIYADSMMVDILIWRTRGRRVSSVGFAPLTIVTSFLPLEIDSFKVFVAAKVTDPIRSIFDKFLSKIVLKCHGHAQKDASISIFSPIVNFNSFFRWITAIKGDFTSSIKVSISVCEHVNHLVIVILLLYLAKPFKISFNWFSG